MLLRGINVGGRTVRMATLTEALRSFDPESVGAAGTLAIRRFPGEAPIARALDAALPFAAASAIVPRREIEHVLGSFPETGPAPEGARRSITVLLEAPTAAPELPLERPLGGRWQTRLLACSGRWVFAWYRRRAEPKERLVYPNEVVERAFGVPATTRWWETVEQVTARLGAPADRGHPGGGERSAKARPAARP